MIFLTTLPNAQKAAHLYAKRWKIECLFRHLKTNGYNLEDLNLKELNKSLLMMAIVTTAYILAIREGWKRRRRIPTQRYQDGSEAPEVSIFREGKNGFNLNKIRAKLQSTSESWIAAIFLS
ncbi:MAG: transposase [Saprospirales bacterium]|nr:transposase [Saprospirales bacterium]MBK8923008.1 transposase [Saprospirales bacterium]